MSDCQRVENLIISIFYQNLPQAGYILTYSIFKDNNVRSLHILYIERTGFYILDSILFVIKKPQLMSSI